MSIEAPYTDINLNFDVVDYSDVKAKTDKNNSKNYDNFLIDKNLMETEKLETSDSGFVDMEQSDEKESLSRERNDSLSDAENSLRDTGSESENDLNLSDTSSDSGLADLSKSTDSIEGMTSSQTSESLENINLHEPAEQKAPKTDTNLNSTDPKNNTSTTDSKLKPSDAGGVLELLKSEFNLLSSGTSKTGKNTETPKKDMESSSKCECVDSAPNKTNSNEPMTEEVCGFDSLPMEMLMYILSFMDVNDSKKCALVCRKWLSVLVLKKYSKNMMLNFIDTYYKEFNVQISSFSNTLRTFPIVAIQTGNFDIASNTFWREYGDRIKELYFRNGIMRKVEFEECVRFTPYIEVLKVEGNNLFRTWDIRGTYHERLISFPNCYHLGLSRNSFMGKKLFEYMVAMCPNLREIDLSYCMRKMPGQERNRFLDHLIFYLKGYGQNIKLLNFSNTLTDDFFLQQLAEVTKLKLKSLTLTFNGSLDKKQGIMPLFSVQNEMEYLDFTESPAVEETLMIHVAKNMKNLKTLILRKCTNITDYCIREVSKLEHLEVFDISGCDYVTDEGIYDGLMKGTPKRKLKKLYFAFLSNLSDSMMFRLGIKFHGQITELDVAGTSISDECLQVIIKHFSKLRYLNLDSCCKLTDYGFTGKNPHDGRTYYPITRLKGLKILKMAMCYKITDAALINSFKFLELRELYIQRTLFSEAGIKAIVENCPSIEVIDITENNIITDDTVEIITKNLKRLQTLKLNGCWNVTERTFDLVYQNCTEIRNLYLRNCENLNADRLTDQLYYMRTLRKVYLE